MTPVSSAMYTMWVVSLPSSLTVVAVVIIVAETSTVTVPMPP